MNLQFLSPISRLIRRSSTGIRDYSGFKLPSGHPSILDQMRDKDVPDVDLDKQTSPLNARRQNTAADSPDAGNYELYDYPEYSVGGQSLRPSVSPHIGTGTISGLGTIDKILMQDYIKNYKKKPSGNDKL